MPAVTQEDHPVASSLQFGLVVRGQAEADEDITKRFDETIELVRFADRLGYDSITNTAHYSAHPWQMLQLVPMLARQFELDGASCSLKPVQKTALAAVRR
jgi:hypothetical protein